MGINEFYYKLININNYSVNSNMQTDIEEKIKKTLDDIYLYSNSLEGLCKVACTNIYNELFSLGYQVNIINLHDLIGIKEHVALILSYINQDELEFILIDPTYSQFVFQEGKILNPCYFEWPGNILKKNDEPFLNDLLLKKYIKVDNVSFNNYLQSFMGYIPLNEKILLEDIMLKERKKL